jgi:hypothetical protein
MRFIFLFLVCAFLLMGIVCSDAALDNVLDELSDEGIELDIDKGDSSYDSDSGVLTVGDTKIDLAKVREYNELDKGGLGSFEFNGESYDKTTRKIESVKVDGETVVYEYEGDVSVSLPKDTEFDLMTKKFKVDGQEFE